MRQFEGLMEEPLRVGPQPVKLLRQDRLHRACGDLGDEGAVLGAVAVEHAIQLVVLVHSHVEERVLVLGACRLAAARMCVRHVATNKARTDTDRRSDRRCGGRRLPPPADWSAGAMATNADASRAVSRAMSRAMSRAASRQWCCC